MDWLENLLPFLLFILYFLAQLRKATKKKAAQPPVPAGTEAQQTPSAPPPVERKRTPFEELLHQIQVASEAAQEPAPKPAPAPGVPPPPPLRPKLAATKPVRKPVPASEFRLSGAFEHDEHGYGPDNPFSEEAFERLPRGLDITEHAPGHLQAGPHRLRARTVTQSRDEWDAAHPLVAKLRSAGSVKEAFALKEILDAPRSRRRSIR